MCPVYFVTIVSGLYPPLVPLTLRGRFREWVLDCRRELVENLDYYPALACENQKKAVKSAQSGSSSAVECFLAKEEVAGSNPVFRSSKLVVVAV
jgi:hypothetical protein